MINLICHQAGLMKPIKLSIYSLYIILFGDAACSRFCYSTSFKFVSVILCNLSLCWRGYKHSSSPRGKRSFKFYWSSHCNSFISVLYISIFSNDCLLSTGISDGEHCQIVKRSWGLSQMFSFPPLCLWSLAHQRSTLQWRHQSGGLEEDHRAYGTIWDRAIQYSLFVSVVKTIL